MCSFMLFTFEGQHWWLLFNNAIRPFNTPQCFARELLNIFGDKTWHLKLYKQKKKGNKYNSASVINYIADLDARTVSEEGLRALRVVKWSVADTPPRGPNGEVATVVQVARAVAVLGCFIDYLERDQYDSG